MKNLFKKGLALRSEATKGFTLIELLIVIALIGILAVALLSAINPLEQLRKGRDSARKADAAELLNAMERYYTSYQCYHWDPACDASVQLTTADFPRFTSPAPAALREDPLLIKNELKQQFADRLNTTGNPSYQKLWIIETGGSTNAAGQVSICFEPESKTGRSGGLGRMIDAPGSTTVVTDCTTTGYNGGGLGGLCYICVPQ